MSLDGCPRFLRAELELVGHKAANETKPSFTKVMAGKSYSNWSFEQ